MKTDSHSPSWTLAVTAAITWNFIITILKFIWYLASWSWSLFSESIHSLADTLNQLLLMVWIKRSNKKADNNYSYWYKKERYFWATISACWIFFIWAWVTIYHWIEWLLHPEPISNILISLWVLIIWFIVEWATLLIAIKSIYDKKLWLIESVKEADNASLAVILEDSIAVLWVLIAWICITLSYYTNIYYFDSIWSIIIGTMLAFVAVFLIKENKHYLIWSSIELDLKDDVIEFMESSEFIDKVIDFKSQMLDDENYLIKCEIEFNGSALLKAINEHNMFEREFDDIKNDYTEFLKFCAYYTNLVPRVMWQKINEIEKEIRDKFPDIKHIDLEIN